MLTYYLRDSLCFPDRFVRPFFYSATERARNPVVLQRPVELAQLFIAPANAEDMNGLASRASLRDHRHGVTGHHDGIGQRKKPHVWVVFNSVPKK